MEIFFSDIRNLNEDEAVSSGTSRAFGSCFASSLLKLAVFKVYGISDLPAIKKEENGKPFFPLFTQIYFSLSHTKTHVLVAVSDFPVGVDVENITPRSAKTISKLATEKELADFSFHELWCLRESYFKLMGEGELRRLRFSREGNKIIATDSSVACRLYDNIPGCADRKSVV